MDVTATLDAPHPPEAVFAWVADLERYPAWLDLVPRAVADGDGAWLGFLPGRLRPLAPSKRLRVALVSLDGPPSARVERPRSDRRRAPPRGGRGGAAETGGGISRGGWEGGTGGGAAGRPESPPGAAASHSRPPTSSPAAGSSSRARPTSPINVRATSTR